MTARRGPGVKEAARTLLPVNWGSWVVSRAEKSLRDGTARLGDREWSPLDPDELWAETHDRGRGRHAHGFTFFADWVGAASQVDEEQARAYAEMISRVAHDWDFRFGSERGSAPEMAYHDETTAQRLLSIVAALDVIEFSDAARAELMDLASRTAAVLREPGFYAGENNHGMFQDVALLTWSVLIADDPADPAGNEAWDLAEARLFQYFSSCYTAEGVHVENTPTYHVMVSRYLPPLKQIFQHSCERSSRLYTRLLDGAERYATHCVTPEGIYPPVSDTQRRRLDTDLNLSTFQGGEFEYAVTGGDRGRRPSATTVAFAESGYAISRSTWGDPEATYLYFSCAYNADYHKHSDEQSIVLRSQGRDLLCEAGAYGYNWKDPFTAYAYSSAAHNSLLVDGRGLPRTEPGEERRSDRWPLNEMKVERADDDLLQACGITRRYPGREWTRAVRLTHGEKPEQSSLCVEDKVRSRVGAANLRFLWHLAPGLTVVPRPRGAEVFDGHTKVLEIAVHSSVDVHVGVTEGKEAPNPQGWFFPTFGEKTPAPVLTIDCWQEDAVISTEFRLSGFRWGDSGRESLRPLLASGTPVPTWFSNDQETAEQKRMAVILAPEGDVESRERLTAELVKAEIPYVYVPGVPGLVDGAHGPDDVLTTFENIAASISGFLRQQRRRGITPHLAMVGSGFLPGVLAALSTGIDAIGLDPVLPFDADDTRAARLSAHLTTRAKAGETPCMEFIVTRDRGSTEDPAMRAIEAAAPVLYYLPSLLPPDAEDIFSDALRNALVARDGTEPRYIAGYARRTRRFVIEILGLDDIRVAVRAFHGKHEVASIPYTPGSSQTVDHDGQGPHRLRIHVRDDASEEIAAFTTGTIRVR